jgi:hypothetical protein
MNFSKLILSGSTDGTPLKISATSAGSADTIHTGSTDADVIDEIWLFAYNSDTDTQELTILAGGTTEPDNVFTKIVVPAQDSVVTVIPGFIIKGNATPIVVKGYAETTNVITVSGWVNRIG